MIGLGTIINTVAVICGGVLGMLLKNGIPKRFEKILMQSLGLATIFIGISGVLKHMLVIENNAISTQGTILLIFSLVIGCLLGEWLNIESKMETIGVKLKALSDKSAAILAATLSASSVRSSESRAGFSS